MNKVHVPDLPAPLWTAAELTGVTGGYWVHEPPAAWLPTGLTFTRRPKFMRPGDIYVTMDSATYNRADALKDDPAKAWDTAAQLPMLMAAGISAIIAQRDIPSAPARLPLLRVADSRRAVLDLARAARARFDGRAIAVTGTAGKSTTKEMLRHVLAQQGPTFATMANFNTRFGVPLSVAQTPRDARYAIYEMSFTSLGAQPAPVSLLARPHAAIITTIGLGQVRSVRTIEETADLKARIFRGLEPDGAAIINRDMPLFERVHGLAQQYRAPRTILFGEHPEAQVRLVSADLRPEHSRATVSVHGERVTCDIPLPGRAMLMNSLAVLAAVHAVGGDWRQAAADLSSYETREGRLRRLAVPLADGDFELIDDSYNAEQASMIANFEVLSLAQPASGARRIAVLGRIGDLVDAGPQMHAELAEPLLAAGVDRVFTLGDELTHLRRRLPAPMLGLHAGSAEELAAAVLAEVRPGDVVSVKGCSVTANFDRVARLLRSGGAAGPDGTAPAESLPAQETACPRSQISLRSRHKLDIALLGDTYFGEYYQRRRALKGRKNYLDAHGYAHSLRNVETFLQRADLAVINLEAALTRATRSPMAGRKDWILDGDPAATLRALQDCNIAAVGLGNNHAVDYGEAGLRQTIAALSARGFRWFGAGRDAIEAQEPLEIRADLRDRSLKISVLAASEYARLHDDLQTYATADHGGVACLSVDFLEAITALKRAEPDRFLIVFPHWGRNYRWRSDEQAEMADWLIAAGADLIIGHGAHMMQEIERRSDRWILYSLGNFVFNSEGEYKKRGVPPYSLLARLRLTHHGHGIDKALYLYPTISDNQQTRFRPRFVDANEFADVVRRLWEKSADLDPSGPFASIGRDEHGWYIRLTLDGGADGKVD